MPQLCVYIESLHYSRIQKCGPAPVFLNAGISVLFFRKISEFSNKH
uniref:Uncharacterized protein n=1 Tax=Anguilla anguilla TaxID=7936 RepID=A0A0E9PGY3_ANGAN